ncbi:hypothetical protein TNCV_3412041 [Trichonephila clavipes]|nr:hypothetical protein TNCV_3412041 [Trichonephila clavipes]
MNHYLGVTTSLPHYDCAGAALLPQECSNLIIRDCRAIYSSLLIKCLNKRSCSVESFRLCSIGHTALLHFVDLRSNFGLPSEQYIIGALLIIPEVLWLSGSASRFHTIAPRFKPRDGQGQLDLSSHQRVDKQIPILLGNLTLRVSRQTDLLAGTSAHAT